MAVTTRPGEFRIEITQAATFHREFPPFNDAITGDPFDFTADPEGEWTARLELRPVDDITADPVTIFATSGEDGVITLSADGVVSLDLADTFTAALDPTQEYAGASHGALVGDLALVDPADDSPWVWFRGFGQVYRQVTGP